MTTIFDNGNFTLSCDVSSLGALGPPDARAEHFWLQFKTKQAAAKRPNEARHAFATVLNRDELGRLRTVIDKALED